MGRDAMRFVGWDSGGDALLAPKSGFMIEWSASS